MTAIAPEAPPPIQAQVIEHFVAVFTFDLGRYVIAAGLMTLILLLAREWAQHRRIQPRRAKRSDYQREVLSSLRTVFVFGLTTLSTLAMKNLGWIQFNEGAIGWPLFTAQLAVIIVAHDAYFYWMHRSLHHKRLFRATHLHHHKSRTPTPWAAYSFSGWEAMTEAAFMPLFLLCATLAGMPYHGLAIFIFLAWMIGRNVIGHCGVEIHPAGWADSKWTGWLTTTTHHDLHHTDGCYNFGLYFTWWDRWMGTEHPQYQERFRAVAKPWRIAPRAAHTVSVALALAMGLAMPLALMAAE
jgi:sterol desaturase/sphingolipid hydroxylase (fatty acid hydroxylase superfamily)